MMRNMKKSIRITATLLSVLWLVFMVFHGILTGKIPLWNFFGSLPTFIFMIIPLIFLVYEAFQRNRKLSGILLAMLSLVLGMTQLDINLFPMKEETKSNQYTEIKVFNWNTYYWDQNKDKDRYYEFLKEQQADIYILQEYLHDSVDWSNPNPGKSEEDVDRSKLFSICSVVPGFPPHYLAIDDTSRIAKEFPGYHIRTNLQFVLISRFPIKQSRADYSEQYAVYDVDIQGRLVRFFNVHMLLHIEPGNPFAPYFFRGVNQRHHARKLAFTNLKEDIKKTKTDYFIAGDFNSTKAMGVMNELLKEHVDAVKYSNELIPFSFEFRGLRLWRFDYGLAPKNNENLKIKTYQNIDHMGLSDHNPQSFVLDIKTMDNQVNPKMYSQK